MYYTANDIYHIYKKVEFNKKGKDFKKSPDINRLSNENIERLQIIADYFNTIWQNIDPEMYIQCGFKIWKNFKIENFHDERVFRKFKALDKKEKIEYEEITEERILYSISYINNKYKSVDNFCKSSNIIRPPIAEYIKNNIDTFTLVYIIENNLGGLREEEKIFLSNVLNNYDDIKYKMYKNHKLIKENI